MSATDSQKAKNVCVCVCVCVCVFVCTQGNRDGGVEVGSGPQPVHLDHHLRHEQSQEDELSEIGRAHV